MNLRWSIAPALLACCSLSSAADPVGLSLFFQNSQASPIKLIDNPSRYLQEVDIIDTSVPSATDQGILPIQQSGEFAGLNWTGIHQVEEDWRPDGAGTFTRQRFYRGAQWMNSLSAFVVTPLNGHGVPVGLPLFANAGIDQDREITDDGFVRRFVARQIATHCPAVNDCTGATFVAQGLVQWRHNLHAADRAVTIPASAAKLRLIWSEQPTVFRDIAVTHVPPSGFPFGYGFVPSLAAVNPPANGQYYQRGEAVKIQLTLRDGQGNRIYPQGSLPTLADVASGADPGGLRYDNASLQTTLYYALKHREANTAMGLAGPQDKLKLSNHVIQLTDFLLPQVPTSTPADGGWTGLVVTIPPAAVIFGILPATTPVSDTVTFTIPNDADPGTYVASIKVRREFAGEALNRGATLDIKVGTNTPAPYVSATGGCSTCHVNASAFGSILHGISDRRACFTCHSGLSVEPDNPIDIRVHTIHDRSNRFDSNIQNCGQCHLTPPPGPARGLLQ